MRYQIILLLFVFFIYAKMLSQNDTIPKLELIENNPIKQLKTNEKKRFDLSGIVKHQGTILVIADKEWNNHIYKLDTAANAFSVSSVKEFSTNGKTDFEGIDVCENKFYLIEEWENDVYEVTFDSGKLDKLVIPWKKHRIDRINWGNKGFEGLAYDCENNILYLAKERQPRKIYKFDLKTKEITEPFASFINEEESGFDIADMKYENGFLYILERGLGLVTKINTQTNEKYSLSFQHLVFKDGQRLYKNDHPEYGMAEALLLTESEIWIGLDNNGNKISEYGKSLGLKDDKPVILIFKRPENF